jgi:hypothetical protein
MLCINRSKILLIRLLQNHRFYKHYHQKIEDIKQDIIDLLNEKKWNDIVWMTIKFKPQETVKVHLYIKEDGEYLTSLIGPKEWNKNYEHIGQFVLSSESNTFRKI